MTRCGDRRSGAGCLTGAALHHGWKVKVAPDEPHVAVPRNRKVGAQRRRNLLVIDGWLVLRFAWEDVMFDRDYVLMVLRSVVALVEGRAIRAGCRCGAA